MGNWKKIIGSIALATTVAATGFYFYYKQALEAYSHKGGLVLEYHSISKQDWGPSLVVYPEVFEKHLQYLQNNGYKMVTVEELGQRLRQGQSVDHYVALSFDDGYKDNYTTALPLLQKYNAKATFLVITNRIGKDIYMNEAEINKMLDAGMEIGSHTCSHNILTDIDPKYLTWEIGSSQFIIEQRFPKAKVRTLAYPNGSYNDAIIDKLKEYGYNQALTGHTGSNDAKLYKSEPMKMNRIIIMDDGKGSEAFKGLLKRGFRRSLFLEWGIDLGE